MKRALYTILVLVCFLFSILAIGCGGSGGIGSIDKGFDPSAYTFRPFTPANTPTLTNGDVRAILQYQNGNIRRLYIGTGNGLFYTDPSQATYVFTRVEAAGLPTATAAQAINALLQANDGSILIGTDGGLFSLDPAGGSVMSVSRLAGEKVMALAEPKAGTFWVGLSSDTATMKSLVRITNGGDFQFYGPTEGITASTVVMIYATEDPFLVVACGQGSPGKGGLFRYNVSLNTFTVIDAPLLNGATMFKKYGDVYYAGGPGSGLLYQTNRDSDWKTLIQDITPYSLEIVPYLGAVRAWLASNDGLRLSFDLANFKLFTKANGLVSNTCNVVTLGAFGTFIAHSGSDGGFSRAELVGE